MCEVWSWHWYLIDTEEVEEMYLYTESEVDEILGCKTSSKGSGTESDEGHEAVLFSRGKIAPCLHNSWDNVRAKKSSVTLRCRTCSAKWKTSNALITRCKLFIQGQCADAACGDVHVHKFKHSVERKKGGSPSKSNTGKAA